MELKGQSPLLGFAQTHTRRWQKVASF